MPEKVKMITRPLESTTLKTILITPEVYEEIMKIQPDEGKPIFMDLAKKYETPHWKGKEKVE